MKKLTQDEIEKIADDKYPYNPNTTTTNILINDARVSGFIAGFLAAQERQTDWVMDTATPDTKKPVLCYGKGGRYFTAIFEKDVFLSYGDEDNDLEVCDDVTHWQPLPSPPPTK